MYKIELVGKLEEYLMELEYNEKAVNTVKKYKCNISVFLNWLEDGEVTKQDIMRFKKYLIDNNFETSTINNYLISVNKYLKWCGAKDILVKQIKQQNKTSLECILSVSDYKRLLKYAKKLGRMDIYYIMKILVMTAIRIEELKSFTVENIESYYIKTYNKGKERDIILRQDLKRELKKYAKENKIKSGYLFPGKVKGKMLHETTIWRQMQRIAGAARVNKNKVHAHSFRHLFAKEFLKDGKHSLAELADILGHKNIETTRIYVRTTNEEKRKKLEEMKW